MAAPSFRSSRQRTRSSPLPSALSGIPENSVKVTPTRFVFSLPLPPSINTQYATVNGRRVLSSTGRRYKSSIAQLLLSALARSPHRATFLQAAQSHYLALSLQFYFPSLLRRDLDGGLKIAQDAVCEAMGINDNRIAEIHLFKLLDRDAPRLDCSLSTITPAPPMSSQKRQAHRPTSNRRIRS